MAELKNYWDWIVKDDVTYQMGPEPHRTFLLNLLKEKEVKSILDVGCGTGPIYQMINAIAPCIDESWKGLFKYKGTDISEGMIRVCKKEFPQGDFEVEDMRHLKELDASWESVLLMHSLDHVDDYVAALSEASRVSSKYILIVLWRNFRPEGTEDNALNDRNMFGRTEEEGSWQDTFLHEYSEKKLKQTFSDLGLKIVLQKYDPEINLGNRTNTLILLEK